MYGSRSVGAPVPLVDRRQQPRAVAGQILRHSATRGDDGREIVGPEPSTTALAIFRAITTP